MIDLEVDRGGLIPRHAVRQYVLGLQTDVFRIGSRPPLEAGEDVRQVQPAPLQQRLRDKHGHLCVIRGLTRFPASAPTHLATAPGIREPGGEGTRRAELEGGSQRVPHRRTDDRRDGVLPALDVFHPGRLSASARRGPCIFVAGPPGPASRFRSFGCRMRAGVCGVTAVPPRPPIRTPGSRSRPRRSTRSTDIKGRHVLIVEDIIDSGPALSWLISNLGSRKPASLKVCTLPREPEAAEVATDVERVGFDIPGS
ncbi:hypothetical protein GCM10010510_24000 [Streptomyces anandii JCM 4720]|nr:hypothetical protein GCM10010510_24000 [Streptomyces anandii JCM 4720]